MCVRASVRTRSRYRDGTQERRLEAAVERLLGFLVGGKVERRGRHGHDQRREQASPQGRDALCAHDGAKRILRTRWTRCQQHQQQQHCDAWRARGTGAVDAYTKVSATRPEERVWP